MSHLSLAIHMVIKPKAVTRSFTKKSAGRLKFFYPYLWLFLSLLGLAACTTSLPETAQRGPVAVEIIADGETRSLTTEATTVRELLAEVNVTLSEADEVTPPLFTPLSDGMRITVVRVREELVAIPQTIPFERSTVRNESMAADDPPVIVQAGQTGLQEVTTRIVYRDGLEAERWETAVVVIDPAQDEIVMVGMGAAGRNNLTFAGNLAYMSDGTAVILRGNTAFPEQINTGDSLDGRVFQLSPGGSHLLYSRMLANETSFNNSLWLVSTERGAQPQPLGVDNVLWAGWNPSQPEQLEIAFTTAISTVNPPGWEANNDLWRGTIDADDPTAFAPEQLIESYPATFGWWGGNYAWAPNGRYIAYSFANQVGVIDLESGAEPPSRRVLHRFPEYNTLADWVWVPTLTWSPDGRFLAFPSAANGSDIPQFDGWVYDVATGVNGRFVEQAGMWGHLHWAPRGGDDLANSHIAFLRTSNPLDSLRSSYTLWLMDRDGSNGRQVYPPPGENSLFPRDPHFMHWGPTGRDIAFIYNDALYLFNLDSKEASRITQDDARSSHPTWAPYGAAISANLPANRSDDNLLSPSNPNSDAGNERSLPETE
jgi:resuscitation-promoting factor RpfB